MKYVVVKKKLYVVRYQSETETSITGTKETYGVEETDRLKKKPAILSSVRSGTSPSKKF